MIEAFFFALRERRVPVSTQEWLTLHRALELGLHESTLDGFYQIARAVLVKRVADFDAFDQAFLAWTEGLAETSLALTKDLEAWLSDPHRARMLTDAERAALQRLNIESLRRQFAERQAEQRERHDGGNRWIGTGGTSPFGSGGTHPTGIRLGEGGGRTAMQVAAERRFRGYRSDVTLDVRQLDVALRGLRDLGRMGAPAELDVDETIAATGRNAGDIDIVMRPGRRNRAKVTLLMDVGGSMDPHAALMSRLLSAASRSGRFARFRSYYFHNCIYGTVYQDATFRLPVSIADLLATFDANEKLLIVADGLMHPAELLEAGYAGRRAGLDWLRDVRAAMRASAWLTPEPEGYWPGTTTALIATVFPMWELTLDGLTAAVKHLIRA